MGFMGWAKRRMARSALRALAEGRHHDRDEQAAFDGIALRAAHREPDDPAALLGSIQAAFWTIFGPGPDVTFTSGELFDAAIEMGRRFQRSAKSSPADKAPSISTAHTKSDNCGRQGGRRTSLTADALSTFLAGLVLQERASAGVIAAAGIEEADSIEACILDLWVVVHPAWRLLRRDVGDTVCTTLLDRARFAVLEYLVTSDALTGIEANALQDRENERYEEYDRLVSNSRSDRAGLVVAERMFNRCDPQQLGMVCLSKIGIEVHSRLVANQAVLRQIEVR